MSSTHQVFQDFTFHNLELLDTFALPTKALAGKPVAQAGSAFYNLTDDLPYVSDGTAWQPVLLGATDVATDVSITAPTIALTADTNGASITGQTTVDLTANTGDVTITSTAAAVNATAETGMIFVTNTGNQEFRSDAGITSFLSSSQIVLTSNGFAASAITLTASAGGITFNTGSSGISFPKTTVSQTVGLTNPVTINSVSGTITTQSATTAPLSKESFTVNNDRVLVGFTTSVVHVTIVSYAGTYGTNGLPVVNIGAVVAGSFTIDVVNVHATNSLSGVLQIDFTVV